MPLLPPSSILVTATTKTSSAECPLGNHVTSNHIDKLSLPISFPSSLFDARLLADLGVLVPDGLLLRPLNSHDYHTGFIQYFDIFYLELLSQLTEVGCVSEAEFLARFHSLQAGYPLAYYIVVLEDLSTHRIVGSATLNLEFKFIHKTGARGKVEDVVVDAEQRGRGLGKLLNEVVVKLAARAGVYKLSLECKDALIPFYEQFGYKKDVGNNFLVQRFDH